MQHSSKISNPIKPLLKEYFFSLYESNMDQEILKFCNAEIEKQKFHYSNSRVAIEYVDINEILKFEAYHYGKIGKKWKEKQFQVFHPVQK